MIRSIFAVVGGFVVVMVVVFAGTAAATELLHPGGLAAAVQKTPEQTPPSYYAFNIVISLMGAVLGGWVTARMAPEREMLHVFGLAGLMILMSLPSVLGYGETAHLQPVWYIWLLPVIGVGGALLGGRMRANAVARKFPEESARNTA